MDKPTVDTYNKMALEYDAETTDFWERFPARIFNEFTEAVGRRGKILDVGSGPGRDGLLLKSNGFDVVGLDASEAMTKLSRSRGLESVIGDLLELPFPEESFDGVWSYTTLLHVPKSQAPKGFKEVQRVLKADGIFGLGLIEGEEEKYRESSGVNMPRWFSYYTKEEVENLLKEHGFEIVYFEQFKPGSKNYLNFISRKK